MMSDIFDHDEPPGERSLGSRHFRSRKELEAENERLLQENEMLSELLSRQFDGSSGEIIDGMQTGENAGEDRPPFAISDAAIDLFEELPEVFTLDEALDRAECLGQLSTEAVSHLRTYLNERMVDQDIDRFLKTGRKPYF